LLAVSFAKVLVVVVCQLEFRNGEPGSLSVTVRRTSVRLPWPSP